MNYTKYFKFLSKNDAPIAGGKGASLGEMTQARIPVPPGFVILASTFETFLEMTDINIEIDSIINKVNHKEIHTVEEASKIIQALIINAEIPEKIENEILAEFKKLDTKYVAVRSSATAEDSSAAAWAGQLDSFLNTTKSNLLANVKNCWASLFTPRAIFYRFEKELNKQKISVAVVVQKMVESEVSGIAFSVHPVTEDRNQIIIEAGFGLGEAIVSGQITPDSYVITKEPFEILDKNIYIQERGIFRHKDNIGNEWRDIFQEKGAQQCLTDEEILELSKIIIQIENHYGFPCDIEWAREKGEFYIVQSRPITTLDFKKKSSAVIKVQKILSRDLPLLDAHAWLKGYSSGMLKHLGWSYSDTLFLRQNNHIETYRPEGEYPEGLMKVVEEKLKDKKWFPSLCENYEKQINRTLNFLDKSIENLDNDNLSNIYQSYVGFIEDIMAPFVIFFTIPNWFNTPEKIKKYSVEIDKSFYFRKKAEHIFPRGSELIDNILQIVNKKLKLDKKLLNLIIPEELINYLDNNKKINKEELIKRQKGVIFSKKGLTFITGNNFNRTLSVLGYYFEEENLRDTESIKGQTAFRGVRRGFVQIILSKDKISDFKQENILVTGMTTPEYISAMKKAVAFVTDEGGVTCHAAIIAREMGKPCIIGTKNATKILKDGDYIEVDADNGVVRILNNNEGQLTVRSADDFWKKSWSLKFNLLLSSYSAEQYTKELFNYVGADIPRTVIVCKDGISTGYVTSKEADIFALHLAKKITQDEKVVKVWADNLIENGKKITETIKKIEKQIPFLNEINKKDYDECIKEFFDYANAHFVVKRTLDCLPKEKQEKFVSILQNARQKTENVYALVEEFIYRYISILAVKTNYSIDALLYLTNREINKYFDNGYLPSEKILLERKSASALVVDKGNYKIIVGEKDVEELEKNITTSNHDGVLRGSPAFPGIITGKVKIIKNSKDYKNFNSGDVLVTIMTRPEHIEFFHKASAIVTDAGGILSHAAISAREFKKPCIIGTNSATQVLKDGDCVEVDANKGIVRILENNTEGDLFKESLSEKLKNIDWDVQRFNAYPFFLSSVATLSGFKLPWGLSYKHFLCISRNKNIEWYYDKKDWQEVGEVFWNKVKTLNNLAKIINGYRSVYKKSSDKAKYDENKLKDYSIEDLKNLLFKQVDVLYSSAGTAHIIECASYVAEQKLFKKYSINPVDIVVSELSFLNKAAMYAHKLCASKKSEKEILKLFKSKYAWIQSSYLGRNEISISQIRELAHKKEKKINNNKFKNKNDPKSKFIEILSHLFSWQDERKAHILQNIYKSQIVLDALADKLNISREVIKFLLPEEIEKITDKNFQKELEERSKIFVDYAPNTLKRVAFTGTKARQFIADFKNKNNKEEIFLKGQPAFKGKVIGIVHVCLSLESIENFREGEILVASMTRPEYSSAMKKALAFVTDEGGVTCHAAIIAREMKKPCIIGTKNATQILKDGDYVEVDADSGIVKKMENYIPKIYQEFEKQLDNHDRFTFYGPNSPLVIGGVAWGNEKYFKKYFPKSRLIPSYLHLVDGRFIISIIDNDAYRDYAVQRFKDFIKGKVTLVQLKKDYDKVNKQVNELYSKKISDPEVVIKKAYDLMLHLFAVTLYSEVFTKEIAEDVLNKKIEESIWEKVANPPFDHFERRWDQLIRKVKNPLEIDFVFMNYYFLPPNEEIFKKWREMKNKPVVEKTKEYTMNQEKWMKYTQFVIELRDIRKDAIFKMGSLLCKAARMVYPELSDDILAHLNPIEIIKNKKPTTEELQKRLKPYILLINSDLNYKYDYDSYNKVKKLINFSEEKPTFIKGFSACKGKFKGKVKIIYDSVNADFKQGDILVTSMTRPEFVPLMKQAGAVITNEGGVTCHAAIISRELGIPCIIGTKNATQILKDGDLIEVDADNGIVNIL